MKRIEFYELTKEAAILKRLEALRNKAIADGHMWLANVLTMKMWELRRKVAA